MLNMIPLEPDAVPKFEAKIVGVIQFQPVTDKSTEPSDALLLLALTTTAVAETLQYEHEAESLIVAKES
jgi:hypothetical protein